MPYISFEIQGMRTLFINTNQIVGIELIDKSDKRILVKIFTTRSETDCTLELDTQENAQFLINDIMAFSLQTILPAKFYSE